ncbi:MAG: hypothetical protein JWN87_1066 [Frankiales bacterium]|nr:hypothetical protein [Frankiales bacterium]
MEEDWLQRLLVHVLQDAEDDPAARIPLPSPDWGLLASGPAVRGVQVYDLEPGRIPGVRCSALRVAQAPRPPGPDSVVPGEHQRGRSVGRLPETGRGYRLAATRLRRVAGYGCARFRPGRLGVVLVVPDDLGPLRQPAGPVRDDRTTSPFAFSASLSLIHLAKISGSRRCEGRAVALELLVAGGDGVAGGRGGGVVVRVLADTPELGGVGVPRRPDQPAKPLDLGAVIGCPPSLGS